MQAYCGYGEGDCDWDGDCKPGLTCGDNNCRSMNPGNRNWDATDDCCSSWDPPLEGNTFIFLETGAVLRHIDFKL